VIAAQIFGEFNTGNVPFNHLALLGGESLMRGYYLGRYRDKNQMAAQVEFRLLPLPLSFTERIGAAVFAGTGQVFSTQDHININNTLWTAGAGLRFLIFKNKDIWTRLDFALTNEGSGIYFFIGEAF
jgi:hemolysin activation/secretion protein